MKIFYLIWMVIGAIIMISADNGQIGLALLLFYGFLFLGNLLLDRN